MATVSVQFINRYPIVNNKGKKQEVSWLFAPVNFQLGLGPCGKVVKNLYINYSDAIVTIMQEHEDGTVKEFIYQMNDIAGRIVVESTGPY